MCCFDICENCLWAELFESCGCMNDKYFPKLSKTQALICLILNCIPFTSGIGTMVSACCDTRGSTCVIIFLGLAQLALTFLIVGWIWSIVHGMRLYLDNKNGHHVVTRNVVTPEA